MAFESHIDRVTPIKCNMDIECMRDMQEGKAIRIWQVDAFEKKPDKHTKKQMKTYNGLQSEFFGTDFADDGAYRERWRCRCGKYVGKVYAREGFVCEECGTNVQMVEAELDKFGYIILDKFYTFTPIFAAKLTEALGKVEGESILAKILEVKFVDDNGDSSYRQKELELEKKHPYLNKGMIWLVDHINEVLDFYAPKRPGQKTLFNELKNDVNDMFTHCVCVYTALLRTEIPGEKGGKEFKLKINTAYKTIVRLANWINENSYLEEEDKTVDWEHNINAKLYAIYEEIMTIFELEYATFQQKQGIIYSKIVGGRYDFTARNIIGPDTGILRADEVELSYSACLELFRNEICNLYTKIYGCTIMETNMAWKKARVKFSKKFYKIMCMLVSEEKYKKFMCVIISRNPMINKHSANFMYVANVKSDIRDKTLTIPSSIMSAQNADIDGDVENVFRVFSERMIKKFNKTMNPRYNIYINRINGRLDPKSMILKDENVCFYMFGNM